MRLLLFAVFLFCDKFLHILLLLTAQILQFPQLVRGEPRIEIPVESALSFQLSAPLTLPPGE